MSMSLRDQLLAAGLVSQKQVRDAERQQQHQQHQQRGQRPKPHRASIPQPTKAIGTGRGEPGRHPSAAAGAAPVTQASVMPNAAARNAAAQSAKVARDLALNRKQQEKAQQRARAAQIKQLIEQNRVPRGENDERYNFVQGGRVRFIGVNAEIRRRLMSGELVIVRHDGVHEVVPAAVGQRVRERDAHAVIDAAPAPAGQAVDDAYKDFAVPDDLMW